jgi:hypothetical protein
MVSSALHQGKERSVIEGQGTFAAQTEYYWQTVLDSWICRPSDIMTLRTAQVIPSGGRLSHDQSI